MSSHVDFATVPDGTVGVQADHPCRSGARVLDSEAGVVERLRDKLAIVGYATSSRDLAPFRDDRYEIVGLNQLYRMIERADFWCDIHVNWNEENVEGTDHQGWLAQCGIPVLMKETVLGIPTSVRYPIERALELGHDYFTSTVAFLIAWGIVQGYKEIGLWGIDLVVGTEYESQRQCAEFWLGVAHGRGIDVRLPAQSALLKQTHRYGYELEPNWGPASIKEIGDRVTMLVAERDRLLQKIHMLQGATQEVARYEEWIADPVKRKDALNTEYRETVTQVATLDGAAQESDYWRQLYLLRHRGAAIAMRNG